MLQPRWQKFLFNASYWLALPILVSLTSVLPGILVTQSTLLLLYLIAVLYTSLRAAHRPPTTTEKSMKRILVIDDEPQIQKFLRISLGSQQYEVFSAETGREGISKALSSRPDLIMRVELQARSLLLHNEVIPLTRKEWAVLLQLLQSSGGLVTQSSLLERIWGKSHVEDSQYLRNVIQKLRQKLQDDAAKPRYIETPGIGYRFIPVTGKGA